MLTLSRGTTAPRRKTNLLRGGGPVTTTGNPWQNPRQARLLSLKPSQSLLGKAMVKIQNQAMVVN